MKYRIPLLYSLFFVLVLSVNYLSNALPLNGNTTGDLSDLYDSMITPSGPAFSIWGLIYLLLLLFVGQVWLNYTSKGSNFKDGLKGLLPFFIINAILNISWLFTWHYELIYVSFGIMIALLLSLIYIYNFVKSNNLWKLPWSIYLGWVSVASIVNASIVLLQLDISLFNNNQEAFTIIMSIIAAALGILFMVKEENLAYPLVISWALYWIGNANRRMETVYYTLFGLAALVLISTTIQFIQSYRTK